MKTQNLLIANEAKVKAEFAQLIDSEKKYLVEQGLGDQIECGISGHVQAEDLFDGCWFDDLEDFWFTLRDCGNGNWRIEVRDRHDGSLLSVRSTALRYQKATSHPSH